MTTPARPVAGGPVPAERIDSIFGSDVFSRTLMRQRLPKEVYRSLLRTIDQGEPLDPAVADVVAAAMKDWAIENGATHYTHWFQPLTGLTAEKHDSLARARRATAAWCSTSRAPSWCRASPTRRASRRAASAPPSRPAATPPGTRPARRS